MMIQRFVTSPTLAPRLRNRLLQRLERALSRLSHWIHSISVRLADANGPKGGVDQDCLMEVRLVSGRSFIASGRGETPLLAFALALARVRRGVLRDRGQILA